MKVNKALAIDADVGASLSSTYTIPALASTKVGIGAGVGEGGEVLATLMDIGSSLSFIDTISTLVLTGVGAKTGIRAVRQTEGEVLERAVGGEGEGELWKSPFEAEFVMGARKSGRDGTMIGDPSKERSDAAPRSTMGEARPDPI